jgi:hypothetical protein
LFTAREAAGDAINFFYKGHRSLPRFCNVCALLHQGKNPDTGVNVPEIVVTISALIAVFANNWATS